MNPQSSEGQRRSDVEARWLADHPGSRISTFGQCDLYEPHEEHVLTTEGGSGWSCPGQASLCRNCDDRKCMSCVCREIHDECHDDCPACCRTRFGNAEGDDPMTDVASWFLDQVAADERDADVVHLSSCSRFAPYDEFSSCDCGYPERIKADCEAKRRIIELHRPDYLFDETQYCSSCGDVPQVSYPCDTLLLFALPYADRPGYQEDWRL